MNYDSYPFWAKSLVWMVLVAIVLELFTTLDFGAWLVLVMAIGTGGIWLTEKAILKAKTDSNKGPE